MSETHSLVDAAIDRVATEEGLAFGAAAMDVMVTVALAMGSALPRELRGVLVAASSRWFGGRRDEGVRLALLAQDCWSFLEAKHGNSTTVVDREDVAVRTLLCVLWDEAPESEEFEMTVDYFVSMVDRFEGVREVVGLVR